MATITTFLQLLRGNTAAHPATHREHLLVLTAMILFLPTFRPQTARAQGYGDTTEPVSETLLSTAVAIGVQVVVTIPSRYDWREHGVDLAVESQGSCGSCWAFAFVKAFEAKLQIKGWGVYDLSEQQLVSKALAGGCCGGNFGAAYSLLESVGPVVESQWPYQERYTNNCDCASMRYCSKELSIPSGATESPADLTSTPPCECLVYSVIDKSAIRPQDVNIIKRSLLLDGPAYLSYAVNYTWGDFWYNGYPGQVFKSDRSRIVGGHAVTLIGWDDDKNAWLCQNSWGWGGPNGDGTFWMDYGEPHGIYNFNIGVGEPGRIEAGFKEWRRTIQIPSLLPHEGGGRIWQDEDATWFFSTCETTAGSGDAWTANYVCTSSDGEVCAYTHDAYAYVRVCAGTGSDARDFGTLIKLDDADRKCSWAGLREFHRNQRLGSSQIYSDWPAGSGGFAVNVYAAWIGIDVYQVYGKLTYDKYIAPWPNPYPKDVQSNSTTFNVGVGASDDYATVLAEQRFLRLQKGNCVSLATYDGSIAGCREDAQQGAVPDYPTGGAREYVLARFLGSLGSDHDVSLENLIGGNIFVAPEDGLLMFYSTLPGSYTDKRGGCIIEVQVCDCTEFNDCGTLIYIEPPYGRELPCILFQADTGQIYHLDEMGSFVAGDRVRVHGMIMCECESSFCNQPVDGCITVITIEPCCDADFCQYERSGQGFSPSSIRAGQTLTLNFGGANCGTTDIPAGWAIRYYASLDTTITSSDYFLYEAVADFGIGAGRQLGLLEEFVFPSSVPTGQYYIGWIFDPTNEICESNENNNAGYVKGARLTVSSSSTGFEGCGTIVRIGEFGRLFRADAGGLYQLSTFADFKAGDHVWVQGQITSGPGTYCGEQIEGFITVTTIRLCSTSCTADFCQYERSGQGFSPSSIRAGQTLTLNFGGANCGTTDIPAGWAIRYYASLDTTITSSDYFLYEAVADFGIGAGRQLGLLEEFVFPSSVPTGQYYIGWIFDPTNEICESNENNNAGYIKTGRVTVGWVGY